jgi:1-aminocyclopropane-1-carboxylate deaminase/D-cysteine desulfhydrase-like pyridoxal-dependent ACC family enzyme
VSQLWPLIDRFPGLGKLDRASLRGGPTPIEQADERLWIKRDDLTADPVGGNKVRALEFLLGPFASGDHVVTGGSRGSTHVLSTLVHARALGIHVDAASWPQDMNDVARIVDARLDREMRRRHFRSPITAAMWLTWRSWRGRNVIPAGGTSPLGILGQVNAGLELADQIRAGHMPPPDHVVVPLGTGGTVAGLALGFELAGLKTTLVGARVVPRVIARISRVRHLIERTRHLLVRTAQVALPRVSETEVEVAEHVYGGAYGRPLAGAPDRTPTGIPLDPTYSAKAFVAALESARAKNTLFWLTFDSRWMTE